MKKEFCFCVTGDECQQWFEKFSDARRAAIYAPWADGRVFRHDCPITVACGFGEIGGRLVFRMPVVEEASPK